MWTRGLLAGILLAAACASPGPAAVAAQDAAPHAPSPPCGAGDATTLVAPAGHAYHFAYFSAQGDEDDYTPALIDSFESMTGKPLAGIVFSNHWGRGGNVNIRFPSSLAQVIWNNGSVPNVRMMPWSKLWVNGQDPSITMQKVLRGAYDAELRQWFRDARDSGIPMVVEFGVEVNGRWFPWNGKWNGGGNTRWGKNRWPDGPERFRKAYRHVVAISRAVGADDLTWSFHVDAGSWPRTWWNKPKWYYPGDGYVDWVAVSNYGEQRPSENDWFPFTEKLGDPSDARSSYRQIVSLAPGKPLALIEFGVTEDPPHDKAGWITDAYNAITPPGNDYNFDLASYWSERWENGDKSISDLRVNSSAASLAAYTAAIADPFFVSTPQFACS
jgi:hypothetical protein